MADDKLSKKMPVWASTMWPQTFEHKSKTHIGGIGSSRNYQPHLRDKAADILFGIYGSAPEERYRTHNIMNFVDFLGAPAFEPYNTSRAIGEGRYKDAILPGISTAAPFLGKPTKLIAEAVRRRRFTGHLLDDSVPKPITEFGPNYEFTGPTQNPAKHTFDQNTPAVSQMPSSADEDVFPPENKELWARPSRRMAPTGPVRKEPRDLALDTPKSSITESADASDVLEAKFTKTGEAAFKPTIIMPPILRPRDQRTLADPYDINFKIPRTPGKRSSPWVSPRPPIVRPPRDFGLDYPNGAVTDANGRLLFDMENRPLTSKRIAGRIKANEPDYSLNPDDVTSIIYDDAGVEIAPESRNKLQLMPGSIGQLSKYPDGRWAEINFWDELPGDQADVTIAHEFGHLLDEIGGRLSTKEIDDELIPLYSAHSTGRIGPPYLLAENLGYRGDMPPRERAAEAFRIYATGPNTMKSMAPKAAAAIREFNPHPFFSKFIQFNGIPIGVTTGAAATAAALGTIGQGNESNAAEAPAQQNSGTKYRKGIGPILGPSASFQPLRNEKLRNLTRILVDLEAKRKARLYGDPR